MTWIMDETVLGPYIFNEEVMNSILLYFRVRYRYGTGTDVAYSVTMR